MNVIESYGFQDEYGSVKEPRRIGTRNPAHATGGDNSGTDSDSEDQVARRANRFGGGLRSAKNALAKLSVMEVEKEESILSSSPVGRRGSGGMGGHPTRVESKDTALSSRLYGLSSGGSSPATSKRGLFKHFRTSKSVNATPDSSPMLRRANMGNDLTGKSVPAHMRLKEDARPSGSASPLMARTMSVMSRAEQWLDGI